MRKNATLIVFLENSGRIDGLALPPWANSLVDWIAEEYAKLAVRLQARRHYRQIVILEDARATSASLWQALLSAGNATVDLLMLVHGRPGYACGFGSGRVGADFFEGMRRLQTAGLARFKLRMVYQMNCYGQSLAAQWLSLGADAVNGSVGVNWMPEPSLSLFLQGWLGGMPFGSAITRSNNLAGRFLGAFWRPSRDENGHLIAHPKIASSHMLVFGTPDLVMR